MTWLPGVSRLEKYAVNIPSKTPKGRYKLSFKLLDRTNEEKQDIQIGISEKIIDNQGFVNLGIVSI
jgi:hypothetical protein